MQCASSCTQATILSQPVAVEGGAIAAAGVQAGPCACVAVPAQLQVLLGDLRLWVCDADGRPSIAFVLAADFDLGSLPLCGEGHRPCSGDKLHTSNRLKSGRA